MSSRLTSGFDTALQRVSDVGVWLVFLVSRVRT